MAWKISDVKILFADDPIRLKAALGKPDIEAQAREVRAGIVAGIPPEADRQLAATWIKAAYEAGVLGVFPLKEGDERAGYYDWRKRYVYYNRNLPEAIICRVIFHETCHDALAHRRVGALRYGVERYDGNRRTLQEKICECAESLEFDNNE